MTEHLKSIVHPTDFSPSSRAAFAHALRIAVAMRCQLHVVHVDREDAEQDWTQFPQVRETLAQWGMLAAGAPAAAIESELGVSIVKVAVGSPDVGRGLGSYLERHPCDLLVLSSHKGDVLARLLEGSIAESLARVAHTQTLFLNDGQRGFVDLDTGAISLGTVLMPIDPALSPLASWRWIEEFAHGLQRPAQIRLLHVGEELPIFQGLLPSIELRQGPVVDTILDYAAEIGADLIAMPTAGRHGLLDALRGSTMERVLHESFCSVLALPV
jgi:nucleotide-binding universal stress UspA family protein